MAFQRTQVSRTGGRARARRRADPAVVLMPRVPLRCACVQSIPPWAQTLGRDRGISIARCRACPAPCRPAVSARSDALVCAHAGSGWPLMPRWAMAATS